MKQQAKITVMLALFVAIVTAGEFPDQAVN